MKKITTTLILIAMGLQYLSAAEINVAQGLNTIVDAIESAASGDVLLLEHGSVYPYDQPVSLDTKVIHIKATGNASLPKPYIFQMPNAVSGNYPERWQLNQDFSIEGIHWDGAKHDGSNSSAFETYTAGLNITIDNCVFTNATMIRLFNAVDRLVVTNTIVYESLHNYSSGSSMDAREHAHKYIKVQNCTFSWDSDTGLPRHWIFGSYNPETMDTLIVDHCNIEANFRGAFTARRARYLQITNNLFVNSRWVGGVDPAYAFPGDNLSDMPYWDCWSDGNVATDVNRCGPQDFVMFETTGSQTIPNQEVNVANNNIFWSDEIEAVWANYDQLYKPTVFSYDFAYLANDDTANFYFEEKLNLANIHQPCVQTLTNVGEFLESQSSVAEADRPRFWEWMGTLGTTIAAPELDEGASSIPIDEFSMRYDTNTVSYRAADGYPVGDLNWFPCEKEKWKNGEPNTGGCWGGVSTEEKTLAKPEFKVMPNPFSDEMTVSYEVRTPGQVSCELYSIAGNRIQTVVNQMQNYGSHKVNMNTTALPSGIYMLKLNAGGQVQTLKLVKQ